MTEKQKNYVRDAMRRARGDDLERMELLAKHLTYAQMEKRSTEAAESYAEYLDRLRKQRAEHEATLAALETLFAIES